MNTIEGAGSIGTRRWGGGEAKILEADGRKGIFLGGPGSGDEVDRRAWAGGVMSQGGERKRPRSLLESGGFAAHLPAWRSPGGSSPERSNGTGGVVPRGTSGLGTEPLADPTRRSRTPEFAPPELRLPSPVPSGFRSGCRMLPPWGTRGQGAEGAPPAGSSRAGVARGAACSGLLTLRPATQRVPGPRRRVPDPLPAALGRGCAPTHVCELAARDRPARSPPTAAASPSPRPSARFSMLGFSFPSSVQINSLPLICSDGSGPLVVGPTFLNAGAGTAIGR